MYACLTVNLKMLRNFQSFYVLTNRISFVLIDLFKACTVEPVYVGLLGPKFLCLNIEVVAYTSGSNQGIKLVLLEWWPFYTGGC